MSFIAKAMAKGLQLAMVLAFYPLFSLHYLIMKMMLSDFQFLFFSKIFFSFLKRSSINH